MSYNFFEPFLRDMKPERKIGANTVIFIAAVVLVAFIGASFGYTVFEKRKLNQEIAELNSFFEDESVKAKMIEIDRKLEEIADIKLKQQYLQYLEKDMKTIDIVNDKLLDFIKKEVVDNLSIQTLDINKGNVNLQGLSLTKIGIAQFEYDLRNSGNFHEVFVPSIDKEGEHFTFSIQFDTVVGGRQ